MLAWWWGGLRPEENEVLNGWLAEVNLVRGVSGMRPPAWQVICNRIATPAV